jgi:hypothetical protein
MLGLGSIYFVLADSLSRLRFLRQGLAVGKPLEPVMRAKGPSAHLCRSTAAVCSREE